MGIPKPSRGYAKHQKGMAVLSFKAVLSFPVNHVVKGRTFSIYQLTTGCGHKQPRLSFDGYFKA
ncbi:MAG: hypothetical protein Sw1PiTSA_10150 [Shewanella algae]